jgi:cation transporter-like permease
MWGRRRGTAPRARNQVLTQGDRGTSEAIARSRTTTAEHSGGAQPYNASPVHSNVAKRYD